MRISVGVGILSALVMSALGCAHSEVSAASPLERAFASDMDGAEGERSIAFPSLFQAPRIPNVLAAPPRSPPPPDPGKKARLVERRRHIAVLEEEIRIKEKILFETASAKIDRASDDLVEAIAWILFEHPDVQFVEIAGHADKRGANEMNRELTRHRAEAVRKRLVELHVDPRRLRSVGYGEYCPIDHGNSEAAFDKNRRVEFRILRRRGRDTATKWGGCDEARRRGQAPQPIPPSAPGR